MLDRCVSVLKRKGAMLIDIVINTRPNHPSEPSRILQVVPVVAEKNLDPKERLLDVTADNPNPFLQLTLHGGNYLDRKQKATLQFECDQTQVSERHLYRAE